jgi:hypothetical protein
MALAEWGRVNQWGQSPEHGFLAKSGNEYLVAWSGAPSASYQALRFESLNDAQRFLKSLDLKMVSVTRSNRFRLTRLWSEQSEEGERVFWKVLSEPEPHRLTFARKEDARFFFDAFERGAYSASPFGHAIYYSRSVPQ